MRITKSNEESERREGEDGLEEKAKRSAFWARRLFFSEKENVFHDWQMLYRSLGSGRRLLEIRLEVARDGSRAQSLPILPVIFDLPRSSEVAIFFSKVKVTWSVKFFFS